jgi:hypothetical protein
MGRGIIDLRNRDANRRDRFRIQRWTAAFRVSSIAIVFLLTSGSLWGQSQSDDMARYGTDKPVVIRSVGAPGGIRSYSAGKWGLAQVSVANRTQDDQVVKASVSVEGNDKLRFSRQVIVPAGSVRATSIPIHIPASVDGERQVALIGRVDGDDGIQSREIEHAARILAPKSVAFIQDSELLSEKETEKIQFEYEAAIALRSANGLSRMMAIIDSRFLPASIEAWEGVDYAILTGRALELNPAARQALRQWIAEGGRLWIQLNQTSLDSVRLLIGSSTDIELVDRVPLNQFQFEVSNTGSQSAPTIVDLEDPVELMRTVIDGAETMYRINGWPALTKTSIGSGAVYLSMLEGRGWVRPRDFRDDPYQDPLYYTDFIALEPLQNFGLNFLQAPAPAPIPQSVSADYAVASIGYQVPERGLIFGILVAFCGVLATAGFTLGRFQKSEHVIWFTLIAGGVATTMIVVSGWWQKGDIPTTASSFAVVEMLPDTGESIARGLVARYSGTADPVDIRTVQHCRIDPQTPELSGKIREFEWVNATQWSWGETPLPPGIQLLNLNRFHSFRTGGWANVEFGPDGLTGRWEGAIYDQQESLAGDSHRVRHGLLVFPNSPAIAVNFNPDGTLVADADDVLAPGQFFSGELLEQRQQRQAAIYQAWFSDYLLRRGTSPKLVVCSDSIPSGLQWQSDVRQLQDSLAVIPVRWLRPEVDGRLRIPGPAISVRSIASEIGQSSIFNNQQEQWLFPATRASVTRLRFQLPQAVLPLRVEQATIEIDCNIPSRLLEIFRVQGESRVPLFARNNATGKLTIDLVADSQIEMDSQGGIIIDFVVGQLNQDVEEATMANSAWSIRSTMLDITGIHSDTNE